MIKFRWEKTNYGYNAWAKKPDSRAYIYFGHFRIKKSALEQYELQFLQTKYFQLYQCHLLSNDALVNCNGNVFEFCMALQTALMSVGN